MKEIFAFIRLTESGVFEKVTWFKNEAGKKEVKIEVARPTPEQAQLIASSRYQEVFV